MENNKDGLLNLCLCEAVTISLKVFNILSLSKYLQNETSRNFSLDLETEKDKNIGQVITDNVIIT